MMLGAGERLARPPIVEDLVVVPLRDMGTSALNASRPDHDLRPEGRLYLYRRIPDGRRRCRKLRRQ
jgi:hypothetical protein